ncbi:hypothetical protein DEO72_LG10g1188 [Vigna unguiculata]|uniref:Uncharacterized protein n=1 Tax=Vigna unguiculata TaxID=3917 RepID=A0A4D6NCV1_VIGUN|nr:hypothetical protein DEO72_LG10g1188 [Vigna unguiculata]
MFLDPSEIFYQDELKLDEIVELYDPIITKLKVFVDTNDVGSIVFFGLIFSPEGIKMVYDRDTVVGLNTEDGVVVDLVVGDELHNSEDGLVKNLTHYDVRTSSLYLNSNFAGQFLDKGRKRYMLTNETTIYWPYVIR